MDRRPRAPSAAETSGATAFAYRRDGHIDIRLRQFGPDDLSVVKSIPGRRWEKERQVWVVPDEPRSIEILTRAFGSRLRIVPSATDRATHRAGEADAATSLQRPAVGAILDALSLAIRARDYSPKTQRAYVAWTRRLLKFQAAEDPSARATLDPAEGRRFLEHLATDGRLSAKTRNQAASALGFLFREVLGQDGFEDVPRAKGPRRLPAVLSHREVLRMLRELGGRNRLIVSLLYSAGLRLEECLGLRVKDIDFELRQILVRDGKGKKDRYVPLAHKAVEFLGARVARRRELHEEDLRRGHGWAPLPAALDRKDPTAGYDFGWQFVFASRAVTTDPASGKSGRRPLHPTAVQREVKRAARRAGINKRVTCHTFRHSFATETLRGGCDIRTLQHVMGHTDVRTTMIYLHVVEQNGFQVRSPLDRPSDPEGPEWDFGPPLQPPGVGPDPAD